MTKRSRLCPLWVAGAGAVLLVPFPATAAPRAYTVIIDNLKFGSLPAGLRKGDSIVWVNRDILKHSATAADHSFDANLPAGAKATTVLRHSGAIPFVCRYHPGMHGTLQVQ